MPLAEIVTAVPPALAPNVIAPLLAVVDKDNVPEALIAPEVLKPALLDTEIILPLELPPPIFKAVPPLPTQVTLPAVLNVRLLVDPVRVVILPVPEARFKLVAVIEPAV